MNIAKLLLPLTIVTALLSAWVYIDIIYFWGMFYITIPLAALVAIITIIYSLIKKKYLYALINFIVGFIAVLSFIIIPW